MMATQPGPAPGPAAQVHGPQWPAMAELWAAQDAPILADTAGCSQAEYDRLVLERQQTEAAYLEGYDRALLRQLEAEKLEPEAGS
jgi:hypothetical protein